MDDLALVIGKVMMYVGGSVLGVFLIGVVAVAAGELWIEASRRWRGIVRAESLIVEYKRCREEFLEWYKVNGGKKGV